MSRAAVVFASLLLLSGCGTAGVVLAGTSLATLIHTDKTPADHAIGYVADMDCSILYAAHKQPYCRDPKAEPNGHERLAALSARLYCYRTLGEVSCYDRPDYMASGQTHLDYAYRPEARPEPQTLAARPQGEIY